MSPEHLHKIRHQKFQYHNSEWLHRIAQSTASASHNDLYMVEYDASPQYETCAGAGRRGAIIGMDEFWSDEDGESDSDDFGRGMVVGGTAALLDGF